MWYVSAAIELARKRNPAEWEFHQTVKEVLSSLEAVVEANPHYQESALLERLIEPERAIMFRVPWLDDGGRGHVNRGFHVEFSSAIGPYAGGLQFHATVNLGIMKFLAFEQVFTNSLTGLSLGGGRGGSDFDPKGKSDREVMRFCQSFMTELSKHIGPQSAIATGGHGVGRREIGYLFGQYKRLRNQFDGALTGKGLDWGGTTQCLEAAGYGAVYFAREMLATRGDSIEGKTCVVSGSGNVALHVAEKINELGGKVVCLSDSDGFIHDPSGIDEEKLAWVMKLKFIRRGRIKEFAEQFPDARYYDARRPWAIPCECAFPCSTQNEISGQDAQVLADNGCLLVCEGANAPTDSDGVRLLQNRKILFGPSKAANAGGIAASGLEISQNAQRARWTREEVDERLKRIMKNIHASAYQAAEEYGLKDNLVAGANIAGFTRVADAVLDQGWV
jgi:glutamate dehydrogenase (NADP+)